MPLEIECVASRQPATMPQIPVSARLDIPSSVWEKYREITILGRTSLSEVLGGVIRRCVKGDTVIFEVSNNVFIGPAYYYDGDGGYIGSINRTHEIDLDKPQPKPPVDLGEYDCQSVYVTSIIASQDDCYADFLFSHLGAFI